MLQKAEVFSSYSVNDVDEAKKFYSEKLGLAVKKVEMGILEFEFPSGQKLMIYPKEDHKPATFTVFNFIVENIEDTVDKLTQSGIKFLQYKGSINTDEKGISRSGDGPTVAWFNDPAGNILSVMQL
ncbi:VOC family protein [Aequorivita echinoideorum]|uniref:VOC family protein n=1 Tax=Aequorivita echinoideorum TaxID=1549647 RepID=A0ABS5S8K0_9FLAO|nr:VOC family protein [Aequorivita echinoideorum]MBT0608200.1 VOC family protein [Aequorivita echinoideorum]